MASDYLLELDGIKGESKDRIHRNAIELESWSFGASNPGASVDGANFSEIKFTKHIDKASPHLILRCATGKHIPKAVLYGRKSSTDTTDYFKVTMEDVLVSSYQVGADGGDLATDSLSLNFAKIEFFYTQGSVTTGPLDDATDDGESGAP
jgi:type VI secretion system secreted protein Hcp